MMKARSGGSTGALRARSCEASAQMCIRDSVIADATVKGLGEYFVGDRLRVWISSGKRTAFVIPSNYVTTRFGIDYVHLHEAGRTIDVPVQRGRDLPSPELPNGLEILSGIRAGDQLVQP